MTHDFNLRHQTAATWEDRAGAAARLLQALPREGTLRIADVGCGDGKLRRRLEALSREFVWTGFDLMPQSTEVIGFDVRRDTLPDGFDAVVLLGVLEYLADPVAALAGLARQAPYIVFSHQFPLSPEPVPGWFERRTVDEVEPWLAPAGLRLLETESASDGQTRLWACCALEVRPSS